MNMTSLLCNAEWDFGTTELLTRAFDQAWEIAKAGGGFHVDSDAPATRLVLATRIIDMVLQGERDLDVLIDGALDVLSGVPPPENAGKARVQHKQIKASTSPGPRLRCPAHLLHLRHLGAQVNHLRQPKVKIHSQNTGKMPTSLRSACPTRLLHLSQCRDFVDRPAGGGPYPRAASAYPAGQRRTRLRHGPCRLG